MQSSDLRKKIFFTNTLDGTKARTEPVGNSFKGFIKTKEGERPVKATDTLLNETIRFGESITEEDYFAE